MTQKNCTEIATASQYLCIEIEGDRSALFSLLLKWNNIGFVGLVQNQFTTNSSKKKPENDFCAENIINSIF